MVRLNKWTWRHSQTLLSDRLTNHAKNDANVLGISKQYDLLWISDGHSNMHTQHSKHDQLGERVSKDV
jgi:hypothetical protein